MNFNLQNGKKHNMKPLFNYRSRKEIETSKRIKVCVAAYAYEIKDKPIMSDAEFDSLAQSVNISVNTDRPDMDEWFRKEFTPYTGSWIHSHPQFERIGEIYEQHYKM